MADKTVNYTEDQTNALVEAYENATNSEERENVVENFASEFGKTTRSIRAKLVREGVYVKKEYKTKTGGRPERKEDIVQDISLILGVDADTALAGLEKATKKTLVLIRSTLSTNKAV